MADLGILYLGLVIGFVVGMGCAAILMHTPEEPRRDRRGIEQ